ncbi:MAG: MgtC/SapB family protein [Patescibacteria group bacterium]
MMYTFIISRLIISALLGFLIGIERDRVHKEAGIRTMSLVALGTTLFTLLSIYGLANTDIDYDPTRIMSNVVTGIGFLGAGIIIFHGERVHNMTTAATIWVMAGIGMAVGMGWYIPAVAVTLLTLIILITVRVLNLEEKIGKKV